MEDDTKLGPQFWDTIRPFDHRLYQNVPLAKLAAVVIYMLSAAKLEGSFNNISVALFKLFPEKFKLVSFPEHPDFIRIDNTLRLDCNHAHYVTGNRIKGFRLTQHGRMVAEEALEVLQSGKPQTKKQLSNPRRNRETRLLTEVSGSQAYKKFKAGKANEIQRYEVCDVLHATLDTKEELLRRNLETLQAYATNLVSFQEYQELAQSVLDFLNHLESKWVEINAE